MLVYIDDSGDGGFKFSDVRGQGATKFFVLAAVVFQQAQDVTATVDAMNACARRNRMQMPEFKYQRLGRRREADCFFNCIATCDFSIRALVVDKRRIHSPRLRGDASQFKAEMHMQLLTHLYGQVDAAKIFIDGRDVRTFGYSDSDYLRMAANAAQAGAVTQVRFIDSHTSRPIQLADMIAGATRRCFEQQEPEHYQTFWRRGWQAAGGSLWRFQ